MFLVRNLPRTLLPFWSLRESTDATLADFSAVLGPSLCIYPVTAHWKLLLLNIAALLAIGWSYSLWSHRQLQHWHWRCHIFPCWNPALHQERMWWGFVLDSSLQYRKPGENSYGQGEWKNVQLYIILCFSHARKLSALVHTLQKEF